jgi:hypothetical protein
MLNSMILIVTDVAIQDSTGDRKGWDGEILRIFRGGYSETRGGVSQS